MGSNQGKRTTTGVGCMKKHKKNKNKASPTTRALFDSVFEQVVKTATENGCLIARLESLRQENSLLRGQICSLNGDAGVLAK